ncbi:MAG TPA: plastocyanin/azurin family copper-binding protein [Chloroflexota bacterium]
MIRLPRTFSWLVSGLVAGIALLPLPASAAGTTWHIAVGAQTADAGVQANGYYANDITVDVGDTIQWDMAAAEIHTVTFLSGQAAPPLFTIVGGNLVPNLQALSPAGGPNYAGSGFVNSGLLGAVGQSFSLTFTAQGTYGFLCLVHSGMTGTVHVAAAGTPYPATQADYDRQTQPLEAQLLGQGRSLSGLAQAAAAQAGPTSVTAGTGQAVSGVGSLAVLRFVPDQRIVHVGDTVTWTNRDPETPHTVTFGNEPPGGPFGAFPPSGTDGPAHATLSAPGQSTNSGFLLSAVPGDSQFNVTFTGPGTYNYICALHDDLGMKGTIVVLP